MGREALRLSAGAGWSAALTAAGVVAVYLAGSRLGTWRPRPDPWSNLLLLIPWGLGQQFALHTVFLREAQATLSRTAGIWLAALMFAALHLPNPFLTVMTGLGALAWCWIYDRYPNLLPMALSHALADARDPLRVRRRDHAPLARRGGILARCVTAESLCIQKETPRVSRGLSGYASAAIKNPAPLTS